jgi:hypothetical protein
MIGGSGWECKCVRGPPCRSGCYHGRRGSIRCGGGAVRVGFMVDKMSLGQVFPSKFSSLSSGNCQYSFFHVSEMLYYLIKMVNQSRYRPGVAQKVPGS